MHQQAGGRWVVLFGENNDPFTHIDRRTELEQWLNERGVVDYQIGVFYVATFGRYADALMTYLAFLP